VSALCAQGDRRDYEGWMRGYVYEILYDAVDMVCGEQADDSELRISTGPIHHTSSTWIGKSPMKSCRYMCYDAGKGRSRVDTSRSISGSNCRYIPQDHSPMAYQHLQRLCCHSRPVSW
jgi:hypothetical protein